VVIAARSMFALPQDDARLRVIESDAWDFVNDAQQRESIGVMQIDLYDATARGPVLDSVAFYRACRDCLSSPGMLSVNLFGDHPSFERNLKHLRTAFEGRVIALPEVHEGNRVVLAFKGPALAFSEAQLAARARHLEDTTELPARNWLARLREVTDQAVDFAI
jgi:spermidine synthase